MTVRAYAPTLLTVAAGAGAGMIGSVAGERMFGLGLPMMLKEYGLNYERRHTKQGYTLPGAERGKLRRLVVEM